MDDSFILLTASLSNELETITAPWHLIILSFSFCPVLEENKVLIGNDAYKKMF